ncbi:hypothetical protein FAIPA1_240015 [Frankia sp. AiPs1]
MERFVRTRDDLSARWIRPRRDGEQPAPARDAGRLITLLDLEWAMAPVPVVSVSRWLSAHQVVREGGLEPPRPRAAGPKPAASAIPPLPRGTSVASERRTLTGRFFSALNSRYAARRHESGYGSNGSHRFAGQDPGEMTLRALGSDVGWPIRTAGWLAALW